MKGEKHLPVSGKRIRLFMILTACLLSIKYIVVDFGIDAEFQITMAYRLVRGDKMLREMWEAYQTSAFLCAFFIKIYLFLFGTTTGIVLYLQTIGVLLKGLIALFLYKIVKNSWGGDCNLAFVMAWVFFLVSPKDVPLPEYANMQIWFSMLLCITIFWYYKTGRKGLVILSAIFYCGAVLSYPSCLILLVGVVFLLLYRGEKADVLLFLAPCFLLGILYLWLVLRNVRFSELPFIIENILAIETSHSTGVGEKYIGYLKDVFRIGIVFAATYLISYGIVKIINGKRVCTKGNCKIATDILWYGFILLLSVYMVIFYKEYIRYSYSILFLGIILIGTHYVKYLPADKLYLYLCGTVISFLNFAATMLLTDLEFIASVPYLVIALVMAFLPIAEMLKMAEGKALQRDLKAAVFCGGVFLLFRNVYIIRPMYYQVNTVFDILGIVKEGPALGIISEYMGPHMQNVSIKEWRQYIKEGSNIYLVGSAFDTLGYLYLDTNVAAPSTVDTPGYNDNLLNYWEMNPDKYPDVIIVSCWYGNIDPGLAEDSWIIKWIEEEYKPEYYIDGEYWRYYFKYK